MLTGSITALITPFKNNEIDYKSLNRIIDLQIEGGSSALVLAGTTGEASTLSMSEHVELIGAAVEHAAGRIPIIGGASSNSTAEAIYLTKSIENAGADATLHATGYYLKPNRQQILRHYQEVNNVAKKPIILYNIPSRTGIDIDINTIISISNLTNVAAIKDSTGIISRVSELMPHVKSSFSCLSGDDGSSLGYIAQGGHGSISVISNIAPQLHAQMINQALDGNFAEAQKILKLLFPIVLAIFEEPSPGGVKYAMSLLGLCSNDIRLPLTEPSPQTKEKIYSVLRTAKLIG